MKKKNTEKASSVATISTASVSNKKVSEVKRTAKVSENGTVEVVVALAKFGTYKKGDVIVMHKTTAEACVKSKAVTYK
tara:strand:- start:475 stop:708 length:234 start_codon:yes stop_codon:yes gene_type:complete